jgi:carboxyl-terminal processing protease
MKLTRGRKSLLACVFCWVVVGAALAEESLQTAYSAILRGDYAAGEAAINPLLKSETTRPQAEQVSGWLESYQKLVSSREQLRRETFDWNVQHAQEQLTAARQLAEQGQDNAARKKVYLALSFAGQAAAYTDDKPALAASPLMKELWPEALAAADKYAQAERWTKALSYYYLLTRINEHDEELESLRDRAARHARLEMIYETSEDVERRIKDVNSELLYRALTLINESYYDKPDFKKMAEGGLDNLVALCNTTRLYEGPDAADDFDGLADPTAREHFLQRLEAERQALKSRVAYTYKDLTALYAAIEQENRRSIELPTGLLIVEFMEGAVEELDDFTSIVWPADSTEFDKMMVGNFVGVGIQLGTDEVSGRLEVVTPLENSPALEKGIRPGDLIIAVDGVSTKNWSTDKAVREITGPEGTQVTLTIYRGGKGDPIDFTLTRRPIELTSIRGVERIDAEHWNYLLDKQAGVAYIRLTNFNPNSAEELLGALNTAQAQGMKGLILDLRYNPGGLLETAVGTVSTFVRQGEVVKTEGRAEEAHTLSVTGQAPFGDLPLVVLVNEHSASASEILAGCLRDHDRAMVLGERTFGKGSVQRVFGLDRGWFHQREPKARLKLTTAKYYLPNGESPHKGPDAEKWGVDPDCVLTLTPKEAVKVLDRQRTAFIIHNGDDSEQEVDAETREQELAALKAEPEEDEAGDDLLSDDDIELLRSDPYEAPDVDPQLQTALLQLRVKLAANMPWPRQQLAQTTAEADTP